MNPACQCGCGQQPPSGKTYLRGHWSRTPAAKAMYAARRMTGNNPNPSGVCLCGCGQTTELAPYSDINRGWVTGLPKRYIHGHSNRGRTGPESSRWKGGRWQHKGGYIYTYVPEHPSANRDGYVYEHRVVAEQVLGRYLETHEKVHHVNGDKTDNRPENLAVMTQSAHMLEHGIEALNRYHAQHPEARREAGSKGAAARWSKPS